MDHRITAIIQEWCQFGMDDHPTYENMPKHPEFVYRVSKEWQGWNIFLNVSEQDPSYLINKKRDQLESVAFNSMKKEIDAVIKAWVDQGKDTNDNNMPRHPEYVYRLSGEWCGWVDVFNLTEDSPNYAEHKKIDRLEDMAFILLHPDDLAKRAMH